MLECDQITGSEVKDSQKHIWTVKLFNEIKSRQ